MTDTLQLSQITCDSDVQSRIGVDWIVVDEYAEAMRAGVVFPPVTVFFDGENYWLADGFHRVDAAKKAELQIITIDIHKGTRRDAILFSVGANADHGKRRTNEDKRQSVMRLLEDEEWEKWSDREIARRVKVHHQMVVLVLSQYIYYKLELGFLYNEFH